MPGRMGGVFCIESWSPDLRNRDTVRPILDYLEQREVARVFLQPVSTPQELRHYLSRFTALTSFHVAFLALHGHSGHVRVGSSDVDLDALTHWGRFDQPADEHVEGDPWRLDLTGKALYLGSCASLDEDPDGGGSLEEVRARTRASVICGYTRNVPWLDVGAVEILLLAELAHAGTLARRDYGRALRTLGKRCGDLLDALGFVSLPDWRGR